MRLRTLTLALFAAFLATSIVVHFLQPDLSPIDDAISYGMNGTGGAILSAGIVAMGLGSLCLVRMLAPIANTRTGLLLLGIWGCSVSIAGIFPPDPAGNWSRPPSLSDKVHAACALTAFLSFPPAAWLLSRRRQYLSVLAIASAVSLIAFFITLAPVFSHRAPHLLGLTERILLALYLAWLTAATTSVRS